MFDLRINNDIAYYSGNAFLTKEHAYPAVGLVFSYQSIFKINYGEKSITTYGAIIPPYLLHELIAEEDIIHFVFIETETILAQKLINFFNLQENKVIALEKPTFQIEPENIFDNSLFNHIIDISFEKTSNEAVDLRMLKVVKHIKSNIGTEKVSIKEAAQFVYLSESRFAHLFKENLSVPFRKYVLWCRMRNAGKLILNGCRFNQAAYQSGFSDAAHFSRTFSSFFGISPSQVLKL